MKLQFLGVGGAFAPMSKGNSNMMLISDSGKRLLIDFGTTAPYILRDEMKIDFKEIDGIYISHAHADHCGGLEFFAFCRYFMPKLDSNGKKIKPKLFCSSEIVSALWEKTLRGGLEDLEGRKANLSDYFEVVSVYEMFEWEGELFELVKTPHIMESYALSITTDTSKVFITTDTQFNPKGFNKLFKNSTMIFHDCETLNGFKSGVHAHYEDLKTLPSEIKSKIYLYHYGDEISTVKQDGFVEFVKKGAIYSI